MFPALDTGVCPPLQSKIQNCSCQRQQRVVTRLGAGTKAGLQGQGSQALCHELGWPMDNQPALAQHTLRQCPDVQFLV